MKSIIIFHTPYGYGYNSVTLVNALKKVYLMNLKKNFIFL